MEVKNIMTWQDFEKYKAREFDRVNGKNNAYSNLRLFNHKEKDVKLIFYRDRHAWCPYCQKIWLWLEFKKIPYKVQKVNMYCYGKKEPWFLQKVPSGKLPAIELNNQIITESDDIIYFLEKEYGSLGTPIFSDELKKIRLLEREIFRYWCEWLCRDSFIFLDKAVRKKNLMVTLNKFEEILIKSKSGLIDPSLNSNSEIKPGTGDIIFIPYLERLNASLCYYKGFNLRKEFPEIDKWFALLETYSSYLGTQGDFHTHSHDLPPQMGGCFKEINNNQIKFSNLIDNGQGLGELEIKYFTEKEYYTKFALARVIKHKDNIIKANPSEPHLFEVALRSALTYMLNGKIYKPDDSTGVGLRYLRDRISVPRDMPLISARIFRSSLEKIASLCKNVNTCEIPTNHRYDQNPENFI